MKKPVFLLLCLIVIVQTAYGQAALGISSSGILYFKDSVLLGTQLNVELYVVNVGDEKYSGPLAVNYELGQVSFIMKGREPVTDFAPNDSHKIKFSIPFNELTASIGSNIIVVWPTGSTIKTRDTITKYVKVFNTSSIGSIRENMIDRVSIFPNPATHFVRIKTLPNEPRPLRITLIDMRGRVYQVQLNAANSIDVSSLPAGLYYLRLTFADGKLAGEKLVVTRQ